MFIIKFLGWGGGGVAEYITCELNLFITCSRWLSYVQEFGASPRSDLYPGIIYTMFFLFLYIRTPCWLPKATSTVNFVIIIFQFFRPNRGHYRGGGGGRGIVNKIYATKSWLGWPLTIWRKEFLLFSVSFYTSYGLFQDPSSPNIPADTFLAVSVVNDCVDSADGCRFSNW